MAIKGELKNGLYKTDEFQIILSFFKEMTFITRGTAEHSWINVLLSERGNLIFDPHPPPPISLS